MYRQRQFDQCDQTPASASGSDAISRRSLLVAGSAAAVTAAMLPTGRARATEFAPQAASRRSSGAFRHSSSPPWVTRMQPPGMVRNHGVCGARTRVRVA